MDPQTKEAAGVLEQAFGFQAGTIAAIVVVTLAVAPYLKRAAFLLPIVRGLFAPEGYEQLRKEVEGMATLVQRLTGAVDKLLNRVEALEATDAAEKYNADVEREVKRRLGLLGREGGDELPSSAPRPA